MRHSQGKNMLSPEAVERGVARFGGEILERIERMRPPDFAERVERDPLVVWSRRGPEFLSRVLRFIDVYPAIRTDAELLEYLAAYVGEPRQILPDREEATDLAPAVRALVRGLHGRFVAAETMDEAVEQCRRLGAARFAFTLDILGEAVTSEAEAEQYFRGYLELIEKASAAVAEWPTPRPLDDCHHGAIPRLNLSIKLSSLYSRFDPIDPEGTFAGVVPRLRAIFASARAHGASVNVDMEQYAFKDLTLDLFKSVLLEEEFRSWRHASLTIQTYLPENRADLAGLAAWAQERGAPVGVRLVKGAYWDYEWQQAQYRNWPSPVYQQREETDRDFEAGIRFLLEHHDHLRPAIASHNVRSAAYAMAAAEALGLPKDCIEHQTLHGLGGELMRAIVDMGCRLRVYRPFGPLVPGMAYLVRRLLEATARSGFLRQMWSQPLAKETLLKPPAEPETGVTRPDDDRFRNEPVTDFSRHEARVAMHAAIEQVRGELGRPYPLWINGHAVTAREEMPWPNPGRTGEIIGRVSKASRRDAANAVRAACCAFPAWSTTSAIERAALLRRAAGLVRARRFELAAWEIFETAKPWREADADVAEAIDYLEFYAREMVRLSAPRRRDVPGERNEYFYEARGVAVAIAPWNFPLAILTGQTAAAVVAGNPVIMKPAEQSSVVAAKMLAIWTEAGAPPGVVQYLPGIGEDVGEYLVKHPQVHLIAFTGSLGAGVRINQAAARLLPRQHHIKRIIAEMGGKNAIVVDRDADLDQAVPGVAISAFGYQGQKCSACARVIVLRDVYEPFLARLVEAVRALPVGPAWDPHAALGPLISAEARERVERYMQMERGHARLVYRGEVSPFEGQGHYVPALILADVDPGSALAQEEVFGPLLCVIPARDFDEALAIANGAAYGLTGGLYSRHPDRIARARREFRVGNLYVNRPITGALVDRQPFGGIKRSGIGSKAGGPDYLLQFLQPVTFTEYTVRRGFAPPESRDDHPGQ